MAIDKKLQIFDDEGNPVDYDILASDVKFNDGKDLPTKLDEMEDEIGEGGYTPPQGGIPKTDLAQSVQDTLDDVANKVDKETGKGLSTNDYTTEEKTKLGNLPTNPVQSISVNGQMQTKDQNGNVNIQVQGAQVTVTTNNDGTFTIHSGDNDYTINLNHTHEDMVKLEKFVESNPPASMTDDKIYVQVDDLTTPTVIEALYIFGLEFAGGGVPDTGEPMISSPSNGSTINLGDNTAGQGVSKTITIKGKNLTGDITVAVGTGLTISYGQSTGQSSVTIPMAQALLGAQVTISYAGSGALDDGSLVISHGGSVLSSVVVVVVVVPTPVALTAIKLNGSQWLKTDYKPKTTTEFEMVLKFSNRNTNSNIGVVVLSTDVYNNYIFRLNVAPNSSNLSVAFGNTTTQNTSYGYQAVEHLTQLEMEADQNVLSYSISGSKGVLGFAGKTHDTTLQATNMPTELMIGYGRSTNSGTDLPFQVYELTIYRLTITEGGTTVRNYIPATLNGVPGLHDTITGAFISSETSTPVVAIE